MKTEIYSAALFAALAAAAPAPIEKRADNIDEVILNYALTLEHLEAAFYKEGLAKYKAADFTKAGFTEKNFYANLKKIGQDEANHVTVIKATQKSLNYSSTAACTYNFGITSPKAFIATASILEGVGVSAYLGAASSITNKNILTAAGSILTVEARHNAFIRNKQDKSPFPQAFDTPLGFNSVYTLAAGFITSCPTTNPALPVKAFPALSAKSAATFKPNQKIVFSVPKDFKTPDGPIYVAWPTIGGSAFQEAKYSAANKTVSSTVPKIDVYGPQGQVYAILTTSNATYTDDNTLAGPAIVSVEKAAKKKAAKTS
ncbi:ferritin-like domain-containing protein [Elsinoe ampelina]|uniref:Ferritin-like domain-containing protein n=1 Tax=Elsinoe ampelina TaxID=302913 RepID=A0A6A6GP25_9PEZI|nr:ferritin-like domain-containing protein [Elsinoe ampelina]